jgi:hypothetical protein
MEKTNAFHRQLDWQWYPRYHELASCTPCGHPGF